MDTKNSIDTTNAKGTVVLAYSGGLDTSFCVVWLQKQGWRVVTVAINTGGFSTTELSAIEQRATGLGAVQHITEDAREELFERYLRYLLYANAKRGGTYPLCVSAERVCQAKRVAEIANELGADAIAHGSTGAGNDQVRFDVVFNVVAPDLELLTPIRTLGLSRKEETQFLKEHGVELDAKVEKYSFNQGMWGTSIGGVETLGSWECLPQEVYPGASSKQAAPEPRQIIISFEQGVPTKLDGDALAPVELIGQLNELGENYAIGRGIHLGDTIVGIKGRVGFSAPAAHILIEAHRELEKLTLSAKQLFWKESLGNLYSTLVHEAQYFDPFCRDLEAFLESSQAIVSGDVRLSLAPGLCTVEGSRSPYSLMDAAKADYGELSQLWDARDASGFSKIYGLGQLVSQRVIADKLKEEA